MGLLVGGESGGADPVEKRRPDEAGHEQDRRNVQEGHARVPPSRGRLVAGPRDLAARPSGREGRR